MRLLLAANNQATRRNEIIKSYLQLGSSSNRYAPRLPQQETKSSTKQLPPTGPILGPENILKTGFAQKGLPSCPSGRHKPQSFIETKTLRFCNLDTKNKCFLRRAQFWVRKTFSKPASLKRASLVALPAAISHKASLKPKRCASATLIQKTSKNEPKHGPKNGTAWRSHFWDRMHCLVKEQKKSTFTVPFLGPSGGTKNETAKSQNQQQRPTRATNKK